MEPQNMKNQNEEKITLASLYALLQKGEEDAQKRSEEFNRDLKESSEKFDRDLKKSEEKFDREMQKSREEFKQRMKESEERSEREWGEIREEQKKRSEKLDREWEKSKENFDKMVIEIGGIGNSNGDVAEEYFINAFEKNPSLNGEIYDKVIYNARLVSEESLKSNEFNDEYDIFLSNGKSAAIIEIKYNLKRGVIKRLLEKGENFRKYHPIFNNHKLYLGIAALSFRKAAEENITKKGIAVIKQVGGKMVINSKNLKEF